MEFLVLADDLMIHKTMYKRPLTDPLVAVSSQYSRTGLSTGNAGGGSGLSTRSPTTASLAFSAHPQLALFGVHNSLPSCVFMTGLSDEAWTQESRPYPLIRAIFLSLATSVTSKGPVHGYLSF